jgi:ABC-type amino acid transport system permease subunit
MNFDWNVIWTHRGALWDGALMTVGLTVLTMLLAVPAAYCWR